MRKGDHHQVQRMFRARVAAQGFTLLAIVGGGLYYGAERQKEREKWKAAAEDKADQQRLKWIRELEARDEEERELKARLEKRKEKKRAADANDTRAAFRGAANAEPPSTVGDAASAEAAPSSKPASGLGLFGGSKEPKKDNKDDPA